MKIISIALSLFIVNLFIGQDFKLDSSFKEQYRFIDWERNRLDFYGESPAFVNFFKKIDSACNHQIATPLNVFHIGGSHIQADIYSHRIRRYIHGMEPHMKGERGLIFPYTLAGTNNPWNYKIESEGDWKGERNSVESHNAIWGMEGIVAHTKDSVVSVKLTNRKNRSYKYHYNEVKVFHNTWDSLYCLSPLDTSIVAKIVRNDSLNFTHFFLSENVTEFEFRIIKEVFDDNAEFVIYGIDLKNNEPGVIYHSIGVNGASFKTYERCELFEHQLNQYPPDLFIISIGTNDTYVDVFDPEDYKQRYERFLKMILRTNPNAAIILTVPNDSYYRKKYANPHTVKAAEVIDELAKKYDMCVWNFYEIMGGKGSSQKWYKNKLMPSDRIHFTPSGYDIKADLFIAAFYQSWDSILGRDSTYLYNKYIDPNSTINYYSPLSELIKESNTDVSDADIESRDGFYYYTIKRGDTLWDIAKAKGTTVSKIESLNPGLKSKSLRVGEKIKIVNQ